MRWRTHGALLEFLQYCRERCRVSRKMTELVTRGKIQIAAGMMELTRYKPSIELFHMNSPKRGLCPMRIHPLVEFKNILIPRFI